MKALGSIQPCCNYSQKLSTLKLSPLSITRYSYSLQQCGVNTFSHGSKQQQVDLTLESLDWEWRPPHCATAAHIYRHIQDSGLSISTTYLQTTPLWTLDQFIVEPLASNLFDIQDNDQWSQSLPTGHLHLCSQPFIVCQVSTYSVSSLGQSWLLVSGPSTHSTKYHCYQ